MDVNMEILKVNNLSFGYTDEKVIKNVGLSVDRGDFLSVIGANGAGKSTFIKLLLGELIPDSGSVTWFGEDVKKVRDWSKIGYVPQLRSFNDGFPASVFEIVATSLYPQAGMFRLLNKTHKQIVYDALETVGMQNYADRLIGKLSGGQQQRVMLAKALAAKPDVMLLDEPVTGIDSDTVYMVYELLKKLVTSGITIVMITHDLALSSNYTNRTVSIENCTLCELTKDEALKKFRHRHVK